MRPLRSLGFARDVLTDGRRFRLLVVVNDLRRECLALVVDGSLSGQRVVRELGRSAELSLPATRRTIQFWRLDHNTQQPRRSPKGLTPFASANRSAVHHNYHGLWL
jgi:hypothetical protein